MEEGLEVRANVCLVWEIMPGMEGLSWRNEREIGNRSVNWALKISLDSRQKSEVDLFT